MHQSGDSKPEGQANEYADSAEYHDSCRPFLGIEIESGFPLSECYQKQNNLAGPCQKYSEELRDYFKDQIDKNF
jgi:hypothetical protein